MSSNWCSRIQDQVQINDLAIPGTHDAAAWTHNWNIWSSTPGTWAQRKNITEQLNLGVRVLDLRVGYASNALMLGFTSFIGMFHGPVYLGLTLGDVLTDVNNWLAQHPQEFVILIFQQQGKPMQGDVSGDVRQLVRTTFGAAWHQFNSNRGSWPTVGELRGRVLAMGRLRSDVNGFCNVRSWLSTGDNTDGVLIDAGTTLKVYLQDRYKNLSGQGGYQSRALDNRNKFDKVRAAARAQVAALPSRVLRVNHMSYSNLRYQPWESGAEVNQLLRNSMLSIKGVLMIDDADQATVNYILQNNYQFLNSNSMVDKSKSFLPGRGWEV